MSRRLDLTNKVFDSLRVLEFHGTNTRGLCVWKCECDCGQVCLRTTKYLRKPRGKTVSCGCKQREKLSKRMKTHGYSRERLYRTYKGIIKRCENSKYKWFKNYGGRGITLCKEWRNDYLIFRRWALENGYEDNLTIERRDNDEPYCSDNCYWIPLSNQSKNRRGCSVITAFGESKLATEWEDDPRSRTTSRTIRRRLRKGWSAEDSIITMPRKMPGSPQDEPANDGEGEGGREKEDALERTTDA